MTPIPRPENVDEDDDLWTPKGCKVEYEKLEVRECLHASHGHRKSAQRKGKETRGRMGGARAAV